MNKRCIGWYTVDMGLEHQGDLSEYQEWRSKTAEYKESESRAAELEKLGTGSIKILDRNIGLTNDAWLVEVEGVNKAIFKPKAGEKEAPYRPDISPGTFYLRETAAFLVDDALETHLVPLTTIREIDGMIGSIQEYVEEAHHPSEIGLNTGKLHALPEDHHHFEQLFRLWLFDYIINNKDRSDSNTLVKGAQLYAIDHGSAFGVSKMQSLAYYYNTEIPKSVAESFIRLKNDKDALEQLQQSMSSLLSEAEVESCIARIKHLGYLLEENNVIQGVNDLPPFPAVRLDSVDIESMSEVDREALILKLSGQ